MITQYSYYAANAFKYYFRHEEKPTKFSSQATENNWNACDQIVKGYDETGRKITKMVYSSNDTMSDAVYEAAKANQVPQDTVWALLATSEKTFARIRGLI